jgi:pyrimidine-nucleoside phosphorylase
MQYNPVELILKKRDGNILNPEEINFFIKAFLKGDITDYQMSAMLMCFYFQGAMPSEITALTQSYIDSGKRIDFDPELPVADKHSTGGVGDKLSLMLAPIAAALGLSVPMISGRGLGHTGGTLDKLEAIPGFNTQYSMEDFKELVLKHGYALVGQSEYLVPADKRIYALRDVTGTVESAALITASIMSKKIAEGSKYLVIDLKIGSGAFMPNLRRARELAEHLKNTGESFGQKVAVVFSNMNSPLGAAVGNALETIEAIEYLKGNYLPDTYEITTALVAEMLIMAGKAQDFPEAEAMIKRVVEDGSALAKFAEIIAAQGGNPKVTEDYSLFDTAKYQIPIIAAESGYVHSIDSRAIGYALVRIKAGRMKTSDTLDYSSGAILKPKIGDQVEAGTEIGIVHANDEALGREVAERIRKAYNILPAAKATDKLIYDIMR